MDFLCFFVYYIIINFEQERMNYMNKILKILLIFCLSFMFFILTSNCFAANIEMNLTSNSTSNSNISSNENTYDNATLDNNEFDNEIDNTESTNSSENSVEADNDRTSVADTLHSLPESELGLTNILNIILIAIGVVLIFLAIAIFIKLK